jgi:hypothetical protein
MRDLPFPTSRPSSEGERPVNFSAALYRPGLAAVFLLQKGDSRFFSAIFASKTVAISPAFRIGRDAMHIQYIWENLR